MADLLTSAEVGEWLRLAPQTLRNLRHKGGGPPFVKFGNAVRYRRTDVDRWLAERTFTRSHDRAAS